MTELLTHKEYQAIAKSMDIPKSAFINGKNRPGHGKKLKTKNPATGELIATIASCNEKDVDLAVKKASEAFNIGVWSRKTPQDRKETLIRLCKLIARNRKELAVIESLESGKPIIDCEQIDIPETINTIKWHAELIDKIYDQTGPLNDNALSLIVREPIGVVAAILPWNFPLLMLAWKIGPALAAGCSIIVKPAEQTSISSLKLANLASEAGIPDGVFQVLPGGGKDVGEPLALHENVDMISFTGSTETGKKILKYSSESNLKKVVLECGGKNPAIVFSDAENLDNVAEHIVTGAFWNMGENCSAISRLIVSKKIKKQLLKKVKLRLRDWKTGDPLNPRNRLGALIDAEHCKKVKSYLNKNIPEGPFVQPTILEVGKKDKLVKDEIFGPILSVIEFSDEDEAIAIANETKYGLTASVFTSSNRKAIRTARELKAGTVTINCYGEGDITTPFGGFKQSGFGGRDNGFHAHDQYTETKTIWIDLNDPTEGDNVG